MHASNLINSLQHLAATGGNYTKAISQAVGLHGDNSKPASILKNMSLNTGLLDNDSITGYRELLALSAKRSLISQIRAASPMRKIPFNVSVLAQTAGSTASWVGEAAAIPVDGAFDVDTTQLKSRKIAAIIPVTKELAKTIEAESTLTADITRAIAVAESDAFFSSAAGTEDTPAGLLHGVVAGTGTTSVADDIAALIDSFTGDLSSAVLLTSPKNGVKLHGAGYETTGAKGGVVAGIPHVAHGSIPDGSAALIDTSRILIADDSVMSLDVSTAAVLNESDSATGDALNLFQSNCVAFRLVREINWQAVTGSVVYLDSLDW